MYTQFQRFVATILLCSLVLKSCTSNTELNYTPKASSTQGLKGGGKYKDEAPSFLAHLHHYDIDYLTLPTLHQACAKNDLRTTKHLLSSPESKKNFAIALTTYHDASPLHIAAICGAYKVVRWLLEQGANVNCKDQYGNTPLHYAVEQNMT